MQDDQAALEQLITDLLGRAMEHVMARPAQDWAQIIREWDEFTASEIIEVVKALDENGLRSLAAGLLHTVAVSRRTALVEEAFPALRISEN